MAKPVSFFKLLKGENYGKLWKKTKEATGNSSSQN